MSIDWEAVAKNNGLSPDDFAKEIYMVAATLGTMTIDKQDGEGVVKFTSSDDVGGIELYIRRTPQGE